MERVPMLAERQIVGPLLIPVFTFKKKKKKKRVVTANGIRAVCSRVVGKAEV
jgi:hypothetical protein